MEVSIKKDKDRGKVVFSDNKVLTVIFPDQKVAKQIEKYLNTEREFKIPESQRIDDYRVDKAKPVDELTYLELALCTIHNELGVLVEWETQKN